MRKLPIISFLLLFVISSSVLADFDYSRFDAFSDGANEKNPLDEGKEDEFFQKLFELNLTGRFREDPFFGRISIQGGRGGIEKENRIFTESSYGWLFGGGMGNLGDWLILGNLMTSDTNDSGFINPEYLLSNDHMFRVSIRPSDKYGFNLAGRFNRDQFQTDYYYEYYDPKVNGGASEDDFDRGFLAQFDHSFSSSSWMMISSSYEAKEYKMAAREQEGSYDMKAPEDYQENDFKGYKDFEEQLFKINGEVIKEYFQEHQIKAGFEVRNSVFERDEGLVKEPAEWPEGGNIGWRSESEYTENRLYIKDQWEASDRLFLEPYLNWRYFSYLRKENKQFILPGFSLSYSPVENLIVMAMFKLSVAPPSPSTVHMEPMNEKTAEKWYMIEDDSVSPQYSRHYEFGVDQNFFNDYRIGVKAFYKSLDDVIVSYDIWSDDEDPLTKRYVFWNGGDGRIWGVKTHLKKRFGKEFSGLAEYLFAEAKAMRSIKPDWVDKLYLEVPRTYYLDSDVRHALKLILDYYTTHLGGFGANLSWDFHTGYPFTPIARTEGASEQMQEAGEPPKNSRRYPPWNEVNLILSKDLNYFNWLQITFDFRIINIFDHENIREVNLLTGDAKPQPFSGNTGSPRKFAASLFFRF